MSVTEFKINFCNALLNLLWKQWGQLGITGYLTHTGKDYVLDPEALLFYSSYISRYDARLYDLIIDWLQCNGDSVNIPRLKTLIKNDTAIAPAPLGFMAACIRTNTSGRWKIFAEDLKTHGKSTQAEPLFLSSGSKPVDFIRAQDKRALKYGFLRNPYIPSGKMTPFSIETDAAFLLQLRGMFGLSARAETVLILLNKEVCKIQDIANVAGFTWKACQDAVKELCSSGLVVKQGYTCYLKNPEALLTFFGREQGVFPDWKGLFHAFSMILRTVSNPKLEGLSEATWRGEIQELFATDIKNTFLTCGIPSLRFMTPEKIDCLPEQIENL